MANGLLSDWMSGTGVYGSPTAIDPQTGVPYADTRAAQLGALGNIGSLLIAAGQPMTGAQRAQLLGQVGPQISGIQTDIYNAAQRRLMQSQFAEKQAELADTAKIRDLMKDPAAFKSVTGYDLGQFTGLSPSEIGGALKQISVSKLSRDPTTELLTAANLKKTLSELEIPQTKEVNGVLYEYNKADKKWVAATEKSEEGRPLTNEELKKYGLPSTTSAKMTKTGPVVLNKPSMNAPQGFYFSRQPGTLSPDDPGELLPTPGGPATQLSSEIAGKKAIIDTFFDRSSMIDEAIKSGAFAETNVTGRMALAANVGEMGEINRIFKQGEDAIRRTLTGAGMAVTEANDYASQYLPSATDSEYTIKKKYDAMTKTLNNMRSSITQGRGGVQDLTSAVTSNLPTEKKKSDEDLINQYLNQ
jgi:hypothetical protein